MRFSVDSNVLFYAVDPHDPAKQSISKRILERSTGLDMFLTNQVIGEFLNVGYRRKPTAIHDLVGLAARWIALYPTVTTKADHFFQGMRLASRYRLQFWDSVILAIVIEAGASALITEDMQDGQIVEGVALINPFAPRNQDRLRDLGLITPAS